MLQDVEEKVMTKEWKSQLQYLFALTLSPETEQSAKGHIYSFFLSFLPSGPLHLCLFLLCGYVTLSLCIPPPQCHGICFCFWASYLSLIVVYCPIKESFTKNNNLKMKWRWERKRSTDCVVFRFWFWFLYGRKLRAELLRPCMSSRLNESSTFRTVRITWYILFSIHQGLLSFVW